MRLNLEETAARLYEPLLQGVLRPLREAVAALCPTEGRVLDCCCGPGGLARMLQGVGRQVTGVDLSAAMLAEARRRSPGVNFLQADAASLPFAAGDYDAAAVCMALHALAPDTAAGVLRELARVSRLVIVADYCLPERNLWVPAVFMAHGVERLVGGEHYRHYRQYMAGGALEGLLLREGLRPVRRISVLGGAGTVAAMDGDMAGSPDGRA